MFTPIPFVRSLILVYLGLVISGCNHLFYYPSSELYYSPKQFKVQFEERTYQTTSGSQIKAWFFPSQKKERCKNKLLIHFHGNAQNISTHFMQMTWLAPEGIDYLIFDYPGYGQSTGVASRKSIYIESLDLINQLLSNSEKNEFRDRQIILYGQSLGGAVLLGILPDLQNHQRIQNIVIEASFISYRHIAVSKLSESWLTWAFQWLPYLLVTDTHSGKGRIKKMANIPPVLVLHGTNDPIVPFEESKQIMNELPGPKEFWPVEGARHLEVLAPQFGTREKLLSKFCNKP